MSHTQTNFEGLHLFFGPQDLSLDKSSLSQLRKVLLSQPDLEWLVQALLELPKTWEILKDAIPHAQKLSGDKNLPALTNWIRFDVLPDELFPLSNILLTPLVVALQLMQYSLFVKQLYPHSAPDEKFPHLHVCKGQTFGLCTGLLSAAAVASSGSFQEMAHNGTVAIRLALAMGAVVDASNQSGTDQYQSLAVSWQNSGSSAELQRAVDACPGVVTHVTIFKRDADIWSRRTSPLFRARNK